MWFAKWFLRDRWNFFDLFWLEIGIRTVWLGHFWRGWLVMLIGAVVSGILSRALEAK